MSIPLDRLYHFIEDIAQHVFQDRVIIYRFYPHGSKNADNMSPLIRHTWYDTELNPSLYCNDQEPLQYDYYNTIGSNTGGKLNLLPHFLKNRTMYEKKLLLHSEKKSADVFKYQQDQFIPVYWWSHAVIALDWFRYAQHVRLNRQPEKTFLVYNRAWSGTREYRLRFAELLTRSNLQHSCQTSVNPVEPEMNVHYSLYHFKNPVWRPQTVLEDYFPTNTAKSHYSADFDIADYKNTDIEVVLETLFDDERWHLTEKSLRPIALGQPFILAATAGSLDYLRSYGFKTFGEIWDEGYDIIADPEQRLQAITDLMRQIVNWDPFTKKTKISQAQAIADHNRKHFFSQQFFDTVISELTANLETGFASMKTTLNYQRWLDLWDTALNNPEILDYITAQTSLDRPTLPVINAIKSWIKAKLDTD